jgi:hydroxymethylbilane synthase
LASHRPDLSFRALVGNVDTRLGKLESGEYDAIVLAMAGLKRLGLLENWDRSKFGKLIPDELPYSVMLPAPGQGVLVLECREDDVLLSEALAAFNDSEAERCSTAERSFLGRFGGGCSVPVAALAQEKDGVLELSGAVASPDGTRVIRDVLRGPSSGAIDIGVRLAEELGNRGGFEVVDAVVRLSEVSP